MCIVNVTFIPDQIIRRFPFITLVSLSVVSVVAMVTRQIMAAS